VPPKRRRPKSASADGGVRGLDRLFRPRAVAVIGASRTDGTIGREILRNLVDGGFEGKVFPVNPHAEVVHSIKCFPRVSAIPDRVDLAVVAVKKELVPAAIADCARKGVGAAVVITAGFKEVGERGAEREAEILETARRHGMRIVGPNCMGIQNTLPGTRLNASFSRSFPHAGPVAVASQSGAMGEAILAHADHINLGVTMFVSLGNRGDVSPNDLIDYWSREESVSCILLYLESFGNPRNFVPIARRVSRTKAIVAVKAGRSERGALAASSHTGALAGADVAADAILKDCGIQRVASVEELFDVALTLSKCPLPAGNQLAVLTNAGGPAILATDAAVSSGLQMAPLLPATRSAIKRQLVPEASILNPIDMVAGAGAKDYDRCLRLLLKDPTVDMVLVIFVPPLTRDPIVVARAVFDAAKGSKKPVVCCFMSREEVLRGIRKAAVEHWVPIYLYPESAVRALTALDERRRILARPEGTVRRYRARRVKLEPGWLGVDARRALTKAYGLRVVPGGLARSAKEAVAIASRVGYPVVAKMSARGVVHKTDVGGVILDVPDAKGVEEAFRNLMREGAEGVNIQKMLKGGRECVLGVATYPSFGPILMFGLGGIYVEVLKDVSFAVCPVSDVRARELVRGIKGYPILRGLRGQKGVDEDALVDAIRRVSQMALDHPEISELEFNPLLAFPDGIMAVDLRVRVT
jgi:acetate---CoA ligase (ADP-forming)